MVGDTQQCDVCVVCALPEEARAFLEVVERQCSLAFEKHIDPQDKYDYRLATIQNDKGVAVTLHVSWLARYGPQEMVFHLQRVLKRYQPRIAIMTGICAGDATCVQLGDLVVAERTFPYNNGKFTRDEDGRTVHEYDAMTYQLDANILQFLGLFDEWKALVAGLQRSPFFPEHREIVCHLKPMASGSAVRSDHPFEDVRAPVRGTVAIDMEGAAFGLVMSRYPLIRWLVVKGVCDYADQDKNDAYHNYAARASALYALSFIRAYVTSERLPKRAEGIWPALAHNSSIIPPFPVLVIGREDDLSRLKARLGIATNKPKRPLTIIRGWPGVGKTTLVSSLAYDADVVATFRDGVLWAPLGGNPTPLSKLRAWGRALGVSDAEQGRTLEESMEQIRSLLHNKRMLLIIDDVWKAEDAAPFKVAGAECTTVITTRFQDVARELATVPKDDIYVLGQLDEENGLELLRILSPTVAEHYLQDSQQLVRDLEGLPLALRVAGGLLEAEASIGWDILELFTELRETAKLLETKAPDDRFDPQTGTTPTIDLLLRKSTDHLDKETRICFTFLGAFAPKPATFDLDAMRAVWLVDDPKPVVRKLVDRGLLEPIRGRFQMHALLVMHAKSLLLDEE